MRGFRNAAAMRLRAGARFVGEATIGGRIYDLGAYPAAAPSADPGDRVFGEVYALPPHPALLGYLDRYEGCAEDAPAPRLYRRAQAQALLRIGGALRVWVYFVNVEPPAARRIASGRYLPRAQRVRGGG
jgi:gamma-glutamylcyclotransferase (GGCT)/AIG2-like uncharacterized protein YtfP